MREKAGQAPILVCAATGKTGAQVVEQLIQRGFPVRAFAHRHDQRTERIRALGAEVVLGDFFDVASLRTAMRGGVERAYFCFPPADGLLEATASFAAVGREVGLKAVVNMSQMHAREGHPSALTRQHWLGERVLDWADIGATHLRSTFFSESYLIVNRESIAAEGRFYLPHGDGRYAPVTCADVARVAAGVLANPDKYAGHVYTVTGSQMMSQREVAAVFSRILEKPVEFIDVPLDHWRQAATASGFPPFLIDHLSYAAEDVKGGRFAAVTDVVAEVGGQKAQSFEDFVRAHAGSFAA